MDLGSIVAHLKLDMSDFSNKVKDALYEVEGFSDKFGTLGKTGQTLQSIGTALTTYVTTPLVGLGTVAAKTFADFDKGMAEVKAITGATGDEFAKLEQLAIKLGASTAFSATEVANAMTEMGKAGWSSTEIYDGMSGVLNAAAASGEDLGLVSTVVADAITGFGLSAKDSARLADLMTQAANGGTIGIGDLGESFKYISPLAKTMGFSVEDVTTAITAMSMSGIKGSQAGTALRTAISAMVVSSVSPLL